MTDPKKPFRELMPSVAAWVDELRAAFGAETVNEAISAGIKGRPTFYARERGREVGTPLASGEGGWDAAGVANRRFCTGCDGRCVGTTIRCSNRERR